MTEVPPISVRLRVDSVTESNKKAPKGASLYLCLLVMPWGA